MAGGTSRTSRTFGATTTAPGEARAFVRHTAAVLGGRPLRDVVAADLELVVSELVTNSLRAGSPTIVVTVAVDEDCVRIDVEDRAHGRPAQRDAGSRDTTGRGLALVSALSEDWGVRMVDDGKVVWAALAR